MTVPIAPKPIAPLSWPMESRQKLLPDSGPLVVKKRSNSSENAIAPDQVVTENCNQTAENKGNSQELRRIHEQVEWAWLNTRFNRDDELFRHEI